MTTAEVNTPDNDPSPRRWQFGIRTLLVATTYLAIALAIVKWWGVAFFVIVALFAAPVVFCRRGKSRDLRALKSAAAYLALSIATLPFINSWWLGELPVLAIPQIPIVEFAHWLRTFIIYKVMYPLGLSRGSASPDMIVASPYALALAYVIPIGILLAVVGWRTRMVAPYRLWACAVVILAIVDFAMMRAFASGPGLSIY